MGCTSCLESAHKGCSITACVTGALKGPGVMARALSGELDAVIIASYTKDHSRYALLFVQAGIPVYLEKPLTDDLYEAFAFVDATGCATLACTRPELPVSPMA